MLVSHSRKLVFVHIQKTGGETASKLLRKNIPDIYRRFKPKHVFAIRGMEELEGWDGYFKFAFVRNPWDRLVSWYNMIRDADTLWRYRAPSNPREELRIEQMRTNKLWRYVLDNSSTFQEFIYNCTDKVEVKDGVSYSFAFNQLDYITDRDGELIVDFVGRFENLESDLFEVFDRLGLELRSIPHENRSGRAHYSLFYTPETEAIVRERFKRDIEYFGYRFES